MDSNDGKRKLKTGSQVLREARAYFDCLRLVGNDS